MGFKRNCLIFMLIFYFQSQFSISDAKRPLETLMKRKQSLLSESKSIHFLHYVTRIGGNYDVIDIAVKDLKIDYSSGNSNAWHARATWNDDYNTTGWSVLQIETNENITDQDQAYAAGLLEGHLTKDLISLHVLNTAEGFCSDQSEICVKLFEFLKENMQWMVDQINAHPDDPYWHQAKLSLSQLEGLYHGYNQTFSSRRGIESFPKLIEDRVEPFTTLLLLQASADVGEIMAALTNTVDPFYASSCSALIKVLPGNSDLFVSQDDWGPYEVLDNNSDLFVSHDTWTEYESMLRILKFYKFNYRYNDQDNVEVPGTYMTFSSYPGILLSIDDFYQTNANLAIIETTIGNSNGDLWKYVTPQLNLYWIRILAANRLASNGVEWAKWFSLHNSGTYNNQWMIVDYNKFTPGQPLRDNLLIVLEQIPGHIVWEDKTSVLRTETYWSSYNLPYYPSIYNMSGVYQNYLKYGDFFSYSNSSRASIFRRDHSKVTDVDSMIRMMRYNDYTNDPFSRCDCDPPYSGENTIAARSDLNPANGKYPFDALGHRDHGATDMKLTSWSMIQKLEFIGISGPTYGGPNIPPFVWSQADFGNSTNHFGHPDRWTFEPYHAEWDL